MLALVHDADQLRRSLWIRTRRAWRTLHAQEGGLVSITLRIPELMNFMPSRIDSDSVYWSRPSEQQMRFAVGRVRTLEADGDRRFVKIKQHFEALCETWQISDPDRAESRAKAFFGFHFACHRPALEQTRSTAFLIIPGLLFEKSGALCTITFTDVAGNFDRAWNNWVQLLARLLTVPEPKRHVEGLKPGAAVRFALPCKDVWLQRVQAALVSIRQGDVKKLVLTRRLRILNEPRVRPAQLVQSMQERHPHCTHFVGFDSHGFWVGASPERLVAVRGQALVADAVAGTAVRGLDPQDDARLSAELLACAKTRREQGLVVDEIKRALEALCTTVYVPSQPSLLKLASVQHLWTPVEGRLRAEVSILDAAAALHPTPAVGGAPRQAALAWLAQHGELQRGWYTGGLGWLSPGGAGDLSVVLRCALLRADHVELFAGAGIVADSDPEAEYAETEWKLQTMLDAFAAA